MRSRSNIVAIVVVFGLGAIVAAARVRSDRTARREPPAPITALWGFTAPWDARSDSSLRQNASHLDAAVTGWLQLDSVTGMPRRAYTDHGRSLAPAVARFALVTSYQATRFHPDMIDRVASDPATLAKVAGEVARIATSDGYRGLVLDLEGARAGDAAQLATFVRAVGDSAHAHAIAPVSITVPAADTAGYPARGFLPGADYVMVMLYDQHWPGSGPGSISSPAWVHNTLARRVAEVGAEHLVAALPAYGYEWRAGQSTLALSYAAAQKVAGQASLPLVRDSITQSLHGSVPGSWDLWLSDGVQLGALRGEVERLGVTRVAIWRLGLEDPEAWTALGR